MIRRGTVRTGSGFAIFRIIFGVFFMAFGIYQLWQGGGGQVAYLPMGIGVFLVFFGAVRLLKPKGFDAKLEIEIPNADERLAEASRLRQAGLISHSEYEAKREEILKNL